MKLIENLVRYLVNPKARLTSPSDSEGVGEVAMESLPAGTRLRLRRILFNLPLVVGSLVAVALAAVVFLGPAWGSYDPYITAQSVTAHYDPELEQLVKPPFEPSAEHPFGTDRWGNDILTLVLYGARVTLVAGLYITLARVVLGTLLGSVAGWWADRLPDRVIMGAMAAVGSVPMLLSSMILILALGIQKGLIVFIVALSVIGWTEIAQLVRGEMLRIRKMRYIEAARSVGLTELQTVVRHALPNILPHLLIVSFLEMGAVLLLVAELGFLGVFIGGGSRYLVDPLGAEGPVQIVEVPEWGGLVAKGAPYIRTYPFQVLGPALAFFVAIVGLNALGEGLRRLMARAGVSTAFLLRKRVLVGVAIFAAMSAYVIDHTGPRASFAKVAAEFDGRRAQEHVTALTQMTVQPTQASETPPAAEYIAETLREFEVERGWRSGFSSYYHAPIQALHVRPAEEPRLTLLDESGDRLHAFQHEVDFGFRIAGHGGSGAVVAPATIMGFEPALFYRFERLDLSDRVVIVFEGSAPADFVDVAVARGARGVLLVAAPDSGTTPAQDQVVGPEGAYLQSPTVPIFRISRAAGQTILNYDDLTLEEALEKPADPDRTGRTWYTRDLSVSVSMSLQLSDPHVTDLPAIMGFVGGYDLDHAHELVVLMTSYRGRSTDPDDQSRLKANDVSGVAIMLELARIWQISGLDPRRSVLFVIWEREQQVDPTYVSAFLQEDTNFRKLVARVPSDPITPASLFRFDDVGAGGETLWVDTGSEEKLRSLFVEAADQMGVPVQIGPAREGSVSADTVPSVTFSWADDGPPPDQGGLDRVAPDKLQVVGQSLALALTRILRQPAY